jgi:hypothetical protein
MLARTMKIDLYTKFVLTVIAAALVLLSAEHYFYPGTAFAQAPQKVIIAGVVDKETMVLPVKIMGGTKYNLLQIDEENPLPVAVVK